MGNDNLAWFLAGVDGAIYLFLIAFLVGHYWAKYQLKRKARRGAHQG